MLRRVLQRLEHAEVDRGLDLLRVAADAFGFDPGGQRGTPGRRAECLRKTAVHEQRRVDPVREVAQFLHRFLQVLADLLEHPLRRLGIRVGDLTREVHADRERHEVLLRTVVQVALDRAALRVTGFDDAHAGRAELVGLPAHLVE